MRTKEIEELDRRLIWHPFTQMKDYMGEVPLVVERGKGSYLVDIYGKSYLDGVSSLWVNLHGHRKKEIDDAIRKQLDRVAHSTLLGISNVPAVELAKELVQIAPVGLKKVFYSDNGSTAVEIAVKIAFQFWKQKGNGGSKHTFLSFTNGYHGDTIGSVSLGGIDLFHETYGALLFRVYRAPYPYCYRCPLERSAPSCGVECLNRVEEILSTRHEEIAALVIEPMIQGAAGMITSPKGYLKGIRELTKRYNVLLIADEVATGFGRTGRMFACDHESISPDLLCLAKGITGGYLPLAATLTTEEIFDAFLGDYREKKTFFHGHSYTGNPLACAAAVANLRVMREERILEKLEQKIQFLSNALQKFRTLEHVGDIRQLGMMVGTELVLNKATKEEYPFEDKVGIRVIQEARERGLIIRPLGNVIVLMPPLSMSQDELSEMLSITYDSIKAVTRPGYDSGDYRNPGPKSNPPQLPP
jgi:adenosylmethionine-8-amino-7-oxononanoate aminotransferase